MSTLTAQTIDLIQMLPEEDLITVNDLLKMLVRSWDPGFVKVTPSEKERLERIEAEMNKGIVYSDEDVWD